MYGSILKQESCNILDWKYLLRFYAVSSTGREPIKRIWREIYGNKYLVLGNEFHFRADFTPFFELFLVDLLDHPRMILNTPVIWWIVKIGRLVTSMCQI